MPTAQVNGNGAEIFYEDSGAPPGSTDYATIVIVHGLVFHSGMPSYDICSITDH